MRVDARVSKRPLLRPQIPSQYISADVEKVVYVSVKTPFISAVKRIEKLLRLSQKRAIQSATARSRKRSKYRSARSAGDDTGDVDAIVEELHADAAKEDVIVKGTGRAISKALEIGVWFQQREEYTVRLKTGTVKAIDDIEIDQDETKLTDEVSVGEPQEMSTKQLADAIKEPSAQPQASALSSEPRDYTRVRQVSCVEIRIAIG